MTRFVCVYNRFLGKITDDMYMELTPQDTVKDLQKLLLNAIPSFEFPRKNLYAYEIKTETVPEDEVGTDDFILGVVWNELTEDDPDAVPQVIIERSTFTADLTEEEMNILAILMMNAWLQRQITSIENTRMKYSGADFKMTSQANHLAKLLSLQTECQRQSLHLQRLYKRRELREQDGMYQSTWYQFGEKHST